MEQLLIGRVLAERYHVEDILGRGGMSVVYRSLDTRLSRPVALKIVAFPPDIADNDRQMLRDRLRREATAAASLSSHPNIVQVYDYGTDADLDLDFIAMELLIGEDLKEVLAGGGMDYPEAVEILGAAAAGVAAGHRAGIIHRDVKPANIFLTSESGRMIVKVLDFGIAKALDPTAGEDLTRHDQAPHSPAYASPEQLSMKGQTFASDVYQLGLVAYELLAGERPFSADDRHLIAAGGKVPLPEGPRWAAVPEAVRTVIRTALASDPAARFRDAIEFCSAFEAAVEGDATVALPEPPRAVASEDPVEVPVDDHTIASSAGGPAVSASERQPMPRQHTAAVPAARPPIAPEPARRSSRKPLLFAGLALAAVLVWLFLRDPSPPSPLVDSDAPTIDNIEVQDAEMRPLMLEAYENLGADVPSQ